MILKKRIANSGEIRCFGVIKNPKDKKKYGRICNHLLMKVNSNYEAAAEIKCPKKGCGALYEIKNGFIHMIPEPHDGRSNKEEKWQQDKASIQSAV